MSEIVDLQEIRESRLETPPAMLRKAMKWVQDNEALTVVVFAVSKDQIMRFLGGDISDPDLYVEVMITSDEIKDAIRERREEEQQEY